MYHLLPIRNSLDGDVEPLCNLFSWYHFVSKEAVGFRKPMDLLWLDYNSTKFLILKEFGHIIKSKEKRKSGKRGWCFWCFIKLFQSYKNVPLSLNHSWWQQVRGCSYISPTLLDTFSPLSGLWHSLHYHPSWVRWW